MTLVVALPETKTGNSFPWNYRLRRAAVLLRRFQRAMAQRRFESRARADIRDPEILAALGIAPVGRSHVDRWIATMMSHRR